MAVSDKVSLFDVGGDMSPLAVGGNVSLLETKAGGILGEGVEVEPVATTVVVAAAVVTMLLVVPPTHTALHPPQ
jgi:uncharacterized spore protein YtfJ